MRPEASITCTELEDVVKLHLSLLLGVRHVSFLEEPEHTTESKKLAINTDRSEVQDHPELI